MNKKKEINSNSVPMLIIDDKSVAANQIVKVDYIMYIEAIDKQIKIVMNDGKILFANEGLKKIMNKLPYYKFLSASKFHIINIDFVQKVSCNKVCNVVLHNGKELLVSPALKSKIVNIFNLKNI